MRYLIILTLTILATAAQAETAEQLRERIEKNPGVISCNWEHKKHPQAIPNHDKLHTGTLAWYYDDADGIRRKGTHEVQIQNLGEGNTEVAVWMDGPPEIDQATDPLGTDAEILTALGKVIVRVEIHRHKIVEDSPPAATVSGVEEVAGKPVEFKVMVYKKGGVIVSGNLTDTKTEPVVK